MAAQTQPRSPLNTYLPYCIGGSCGTRPPRAPWATRAQTELQRRQQEEEEEAEMEARQTRTAAAAAAAAAGAADSQQSGQTATAAPPPAEPGVSATTTAATAAAATAAAATAALLQELNASARHAAGLQVELESSRRRAHEAERALDREVARSDSYRARMREYRHRLRSSERDSRHRDEEVARMLDALRLQFRDVLDNWAEHISALRQSDQQKSKQLHNMEERMSEYAQQMDRTNTKLQQMRRSQRDDGESNNHSNSNIRSEKSRRSSENKHATAASIDRFSSRDGAGGSAVALASPAPAAAAAPSASASTSASSPPSPSPAVAVRGAGAISAPAVGSRPGSSPSTTAAAAALAHASSLLADIAAQKQATQHIVEERSGASSNRSHTRCKCDCHEEQGWQQQPQAVATLVAVPISSCCCRTGCCCCGCSCSRSASRSRSRSRSRAAGQRSGSTTSRPRFSTVTPSTGAPIPSLIGASRSASASSSFSPRSSSSPRVGRGRSPAASSQPAFLSAAHPSYLHTRSSSLKRADTVAAAAAAGRASPGRNLVGPFTSSFPSRPCSGAPRHTPRSYLDAPAHSPPRGSSRSHEDGHGSGARQFAHGLGVAHEPVLSYSYSASGDILASNLSSSTRRSRKQ